MRNVDHLPSYKISFEGEFEKRYFVGGASKTKIREKININVQKFLLENKGVLIRMVNEGLLLFYNKHVSFTKIHRDIIKLLLYWR